MIFCTQEKQAIIEKLKILGQQWDERVGTLTLNLSQGAPPKKSAGYLSKKWVATQKLTVKLERKLQFS